MSKHSGFQLHECALLLVESVGLCIIINTNAISHSRVAQHTLRLDSRSWVALLKLKKARITRCLFEAGAQCDSIYSDSGGLNKLHF